MKCPSEEQLISLITCTATESNYAAIYSHVENCDNCQKWIEANSEIINVLSNDSLPQAPDYLHRKIMSAFPAESFFSKILSLFTIKRLPLSLPAVAVLGLLLIAFYGPSHLFRTFNSDREFEVACAANSGLRELVTGLCDTVAAPGLILNVNDGELSRLDWYGKGVVAINGPARVEVGENGIFLREGVVTCKVKPGTEGFFVATMFQQATVVGTCFQVSAASDRGRVVVFEGVVRVSNALTDDVELVRAGGSVQAVVATDALVPGKGGETIDSVTDLSGAGSSAVNSSEADNSVDLSAQGTQDASSSNGNGQRTDNSLSSVSAGKARRERSLSTEQPVSSKADLPLNNSEQEVTRVIEKTNIMNSSSEDEITSGSGQGPLTIEEGF